jgi:hypothetical protein
LNFGFPRGATRLLKVSGMAAAKALASPIPFTELPHWAAKDCPERRNPEAAG